MPPVSAPRGPSILLALFATAGGCYQGSRDAVYSLTIRNATDAPVFVEVLSAGQASLQHLSADLAPAGELRTQFEVYPADALVEARLRPPAVASNLVSLHPLRPGDRRYEITRSSEGLALVAVTPPVDHWRPGN